MNDRARRATVGGIVAGLIGGVVLSFYMLGMNLLAGQDIWGVAKMAGLPLLGEVAMQPGFALGPVLVGLLCHFAVSMAWGVLFGWIAFGRSRATTLALGAAWGIVVWLGMFYIVLPLAGAEQLAQTVPVSTAAFEHLLFGVAVAIGFLPWRMLDAQILPLPHQRAA